MISWYNSEKFRQNCLSFQLISSDDQFSGTDKENLRRRNALQHCLAEMAPHAANGVRSCVRDCLYAIAPVELWKYRYFTSQGRSTARSYSLLEDMPHCYQAILAVCAQLTRLPQQTIVTAISDVIKSCRHRAASRMYRRLHPELGLVDETLQDENDPLDNLENLGTCSNSSSDAWLSLAFLSPLAWLLFLFFTHTCYIK